MRHVESLSSDSFSPLGLTSSVTTEAEGESTTDRPGVESTELQLGSDQTLISTTRTISSRDMSGLSDIAYSVQGTVELMTTISSGYSPGTNSFLEPSTQVVTTIQNPVFSSSSSTRSTYFMQTISDQTMSLIAHLDRASHMTTSSDLVSVVVSASIVSANGDSVFKETGSSHTINFGETMGTSLYFSSSTEEPPLIYGSEEFTFDSSSALETVEITTTIQSGCCI